MGMQGEGLQNYSPTWILSFHVPAKFGESFFRQFDMAMQLRKEELKKQGKVDAEVSEDTEEDVISTCLESQSITCWEAAKILGNEGKTENLGHPSAWLAKNYWPDKLC